MQAVKIGLKAIRKANCIIKNISWRDESNVQLWNQEANDYVRDAISTCNGGLMVTKFGTIELNALCMIKNSDMPLIEKCKNYIENCGDIFVDDALNMMCNNAGFFPDDEQALNRWENLVLEDIKQIDIMGSYINQEKYLSNELKSVVKINIEGYCAPFLWNNPWTVALRGKKVLVIHPFEESIRRQYKIREKLFDDQNVLPEFAKLETIKAVQSIAGNTTAFDSWFDALAYMEKKIDEADFDVALIGCGAYGMNLAAYVKRKGKIAIHMAGWTQMLFGVYGRRWTIDEPQYNKFINENWVRPCENEKPKNLEAVENGCYW